MGLPASSQGSEFSKNVKSPLSNLNILYFVCKWLETKNFQNWFLSKTEEQNDKITKLSQLNSSKNIVNKLFDYDNNEYNGSIVFGKKNGKGKLVYNGKNMIYFGMFINDSREIKGNLSSFDNTSAALSISMVSSCNSSGFANNHLCTLDRHIHRKLWRSLFILFLIASSNLSAIFFSYAPIYRASISSQVRYLPSHPFLPLFLLILSISFSSQFFQFTLVISHHCWLIAFLD